MPDSLKTPSLLVVWFKCCVFCFVFYPLTSIGAKPCFIQTPYFMERTKVFFKSSRVCAISKISCCPTIIAVGHFDRGRVSLSNCERVPCWMTSERWLTWACEGRAEPLLREAIPRQWISLMFQVKCHNSCLKATCVLFHTVSERSAQ